MCFSDNMEPDIYVLRYVIKISNGTNFLLFINEDHNYFPDVQEQNETLADVCKRLAKVHRVRFGYELKFENIKPSDLFEHWNYGIKGFAEKEYLYTLMVHSYKMVLDLMEKEKNECD